MPITEESLNAMWQPKQEKGFLSRAWDDVSQAAGDFKTGAEQAVAEVDRENTAVNDLYEKDENGAFATDENGYAILKDGVSEDYANESLDLRNKAVKDYNEQIGSTAGTTALSILLPQVGIPTTIAYMAGKGYEKDGIGGAIKEAWYGPLEDWYNQPDLGQQFHDRPVTTTASGILGAGMVALPALAFLKGFSGIRGRFKGRTPVEGDAEISPYLQKVIESDQEKAPADMETAPSEYARSVVEGNKIPKMDDAEAASFSFEENPETINSKTWYHGTGTDGLTADMLDPNSTKIEGLFGHGIYLTDNIEIANGYATARGKRTGTPIVYEAKVNTDNVLNLEKPMPDNAYAVFEGTAKSIAERYDAPWLVDEIKSLKKSNGEEVYSALSRGVEDISNSERIPKSEFVEDFQDLSSNLKSAGYDAYTHIGGKRTGKDPHQVLIMLDPNETLSNTGRKGQITSFEKSVEGTETPNISPNLQAVIEASRKANEPSDILKEVIARSEAEAKQAEAKMTPEDFMDAAHKAAEEGDYRTASRMAEKGGDSDWAETYRRELMKENESGASALEDVENRLGEVINQEIEPISPPIGLSLKITNKVPKDSTTEKFSFENKETESRWKEAAQGVQDQSIFNKIREYWADIKNKATRTYEDLPNTGEFSQLKFDLLKLEKQKDVAGDRSARILQGITIKLDKPSIDLFARKVVLDDLSSQKAGDLPFGFSRESLAKEKAALDKIVETSKDVLDAIKTRKEAWNALKQDYSQAMSDVGFDVSGKLSKEDYFRHQVLEYAKMRAITGSGEKLKTPTNRGFLKAREGSAKDINANYLQAEFEVMAQMIYDTELAKTIKAVDENYSIRNKIKSDAKEENRALFDKTATEEQKMEVKSLEYSLKNKNINENQLLSIHNKINSIVKKVLGGEYIEWRDKIPEGYTTWQPREGSSFYMASSIPESVAEKVLTGAMEEVGVSAEQIRHVLAKGSPFKEMVVKQEIADTLNKISQPPSDNPISSLSRSIIRPWKFWVLMSPTRIIKYNLRNITGDADALFAMNPSAFKKVPQAVKELYQVFYGDRAMSGNMRDWFERGGMETTLNVQELPDVNKLRMFEKFGDKDPNFIKTAWTEYWAKARTATQFREAIFRYATYLDYLGQIGEGKRPKNFGASMPEEIMALSDARDKAFKLSNEVLGAYDSVSVLGKTVRAHFLPFWSFLETNFGRYKQFFSNEVSGGNLSDAITRKMIGSVLIRSPYYAYKVGSFTVKAGAMWAMLQAYNNLVFPREENDLPLDEQARPHIILGRDQDGKVRYFNRLGSFSDVLEWFGADTPVKDMKDFLDGTRSLKEIVQDMAKSPVNKIVNGISPTIKTPGELLTGKKLFPDSFQPGTIRDSGQYVADSLGLGNEFKSITRSRLAEMAGVSPRPGKYGVYEFFDNITHYKAEPNQTAYYKIKYKMHDFLKKEGKGGEGDFMSPKTEALRNYKIALRYQDADSATYYLQEYEKAGGTKKGLEKSLEAMEPLSALGAKDKEKFKSSLSEEDKKELEKATVYYKNVLMGPSN